jgi:hypothetical protein
MSNGLPGNDLAITSGTVAAPGQVTEVSVTIPASAFGNRQSIIIGTATTPGLTLQPVLKFALGPDGEKLPVHPGAPATPGIHDFATAFVEVDKPGTLTLGIAGIAKSTGSFQVEAYLPGDVNGDGVITVADAELFVKDFGGAINPALLTPPKAPPATSKSPKYVLAADANRNGVVAMGDGRYLLRNEVTLTPKIPLTFDNVRLADGEEARGPTPANSGAKTYLQNVTVVGHTTPGSIIFTDFKRGFYFFNDPPVVANASGDFAIPYHLSAGVNTLTLQAIDPFGQQTIRSFPVMWLAFAAPGSTLH